MNFTFAGGDPARAKADVLVIPVFDNELSDKKKQAAALTSADKKLKGLLLKTAAQEGFKGKGEQLLSLHTHGKLGAPRVLLVGLGARARFNAEVLRLAMGRAIKTANRLRAKTAVIATLFSCAATCPAQVTPSGSAKGAMNRPVAMAPQVPPTPWTPNTSSESS